MQVVKTEGSRPIKLWVGDKVFKGATAEDVLMNGAIEPDVEAAAMLQLKQLARLPFIHSNGLAVMPDVHAGIGSTVGTVIATIDAVIPAAVGVDIGCGMNAVRLNLTAKDLPDNLSGLRDRIEKAVPLGTAGHKDWAKFWPKACGGVHEFGETGYGMRQLPMELVDTLFKGNKEQAVDKYMGQIGTLGSGNHFIEICLDEADHVWVMLHSGSRGIGNMIGRHYIEKAKRDMERWFITLPDKDLAYFPEGSENFEAYRRAVHWAQDYALENRKAMMRATLAAIAELGLSEGLLATEEGVNCHHNYVERENHFGKNLWVTRKGAVSARKDQLGIIPGSMGQKSYIVKGKGNPESYCSCSHGAGRAMSRTDAKRRFSLQDLLKQTEGVECRKDAEVIDEIPGAYKNLDTVMENQKDLVEVVHTLKAVLCVKGN